MNKTLFAAADFLSRPPGFYAVLLAMMLLAGVAYVGNVNVVNFALSEVAIVITGVVLLQGSRETAAIQAKLDELIRVTAARNDLIGLERQEQGEIERQRERTERLV